ncbi:hypothetical protein QQF64_023848 [Cirrhinus molitorella]|uniref:Uncharacterized protein n=1 Tax=Cirrhinus molitorella TaxID=172907 RepID=A0ABR3NJR3_9TELE
MVECIAYSFLCDSYRETWKQQESQTARASSTDVIVAQKGNMPAPGTSQGHASIPPVVINLDPFVENCDWKLEPGPKEAAKKFRDDILNKHATGKPLSLVMDLGDSAEDRERAILSFYKMACVDWASPLTCTLKVPGGTLLFDGEKDHLIHSTSPFLLESDFFVVAGRMIGHSFLHGGPCLAGLSPAFMYSLVDHQKKP